MKHSKYRNSGLLFELLVRQVTAEALSNKPAHAANILKKYFSKGELAKEQKLYEIISISQTPSESKAEMILNTVCEANKKLKRTLLKKKRYDLIKEIKSHYNLDTFLQYRVPNYKTLASTYMLFEEGAEPQQIIDNKTTILEHITKKSIIKVDEVVEEYNKMDKDLRILTYRKLFENFNTKYSDLDSEQRLILKEYISTDPNTQEFKDFINKKLVEVKKQLKSLNHKVTDKTTQIKIDEVVLLLNEIPKDKSVKDETVTNLMQCYELIKSLK